MFEHICIDEGRGLTSLYPVQAQHIALLGRMDLFNILTFLLYRLPLYGAVVIEG